MVWVRRVFAVVVGLIVAFALVGGIEAISTMLYAPPEGLDWNKPQSVEDYVNGLPLPALLIVLAAFFTGTFVGGLVAALIAGERPQLYASIIAGFILAATALNLYMIPHPRWFVYVALLGIPVMGIIAGNLVPKRRAAAAKGEAKKDE